MLQSFHDPKSTHTHTLVISVNPVVIWVNANTRKIAAQSSSACNTILKFWPHFALQQTAGYCYRAVCGGASVVISDVSGPTRLAVGCEFDRATIHNHKSQSTYSKRKWLVVQHRRKTKIEKDINY